MRILPFTLFLIFILYSNNALCGAPEKYLKNPEPWFRTKEAEQILKCILSYQSEQGGWPKNIDTTRNFYTGDKSGLKPTFDNGATIDELRYLARYYQITKNEEARSAFLKGFDYIIKAQYPNGGWPQFYPPPKSYHRYITFNDNAFVRIMYFLRDATKYEFLDEQRKEQAKSAFNRGIDCILKCQIKLNGKLTAWCAQHDEVTLKPAPARTFELASISSAESVGIVRLLMSIENPSREIIQAIESAIEWFNSSKITGIKVVELKDVKLPNGKDKIVVEDPDAPPIWARFYEIETNKPIFADRDGVKKYSLAEIGYERRNGYAWYGYWPAKLLEKDYPEWKKRLSLK